MIQMILLHPSTRAGKDYAAGEIVHVEAQLAADLLEWGQARLMDRADLALVINSHAGAPYRPVVGWFR